MCVYVCKYVYSEKVDRLWKRKQNLNQIGLILNNTFQFCIDPVSLPR